MSESVPIFAPCANKACRCSNTFAKRWTVARSSLSKFKNDLSSYEPTAKYAKYANEGMWPGSFSRIWRISRFTSPPKKISADERFSLKASSAVADLNR